MYQQPNQMHLSYGNSMPENGQTSMSMNGYHVNPHQDNKQQWKDYCHQHMYYMVIIEMNDGKQYEGIIEDMDDNHVYMLMPAGDEEEEMEGSQNRQFGYGYGYGPGWGYGYGYPRRFRRFRRYRFPFFGIRSFFFPYFY
ncbi:hypothetical protein [Pontibacillus litoralis]|uniref:Uncharacterized protein n=1 Tax=Pontibacillus litoralis JSM 072002 TaxID=1385512 RepID=A0A0A5G4Y7_9BACI|nr:hypothetical protein [Pontibacillus litoralis]KGX88186.1 hypothetical protein N784_10650 [Pontibacillus litoralis JSM 072002]